MKHKLFGIIICMLLIGTVLPVTGTMTKNKNQISILNPPQQLPITTGVDFNISFYQPSTMTYQKIISPSLPIIWYIGRFSVIDFSNSLVGRIECIKQSTGSETVKTFTYLMVGFFFTGPNFSDLQYNESTGLGYITGEGALLFYFGL